MATTRRDVSAVDIAGNRLRLVDCVAQAMTHPPASRIGPRRQLGLHMMIIHSGAMSVRVDDRDRYTVSAGQMCLLLPDHEEEIRFSDEVETSQTLVRGTPVDLADPVRDWLEGLRPTRRLSSALTYLAREAVVTEQTRLTAGGALVDALATSLLWRFIAEFQNYPAALPEAIETARLYIHNHVHEEITLADIAHAASVTPAYLIRLFRRHMGTTPIRYLWDRRITLGVELLTSSGLSVGAIASRSGFKTSFHFARKIKESTGLSPTQLRSRTWQPPTRG